MARRLPACLSSEWLMFSNHFDDGAPARAPPCGFFMTEQTIPVVAADQETPVANGFAKLGLAPELLAAVADLGFTQPTAVQ
jgi:hypothetical protein